MISSHVTSLFSIYRISYLVAHKFPLRLCKALNFDHNTHYRIALKIGIFFAVKFWSFSQTIPACQTIAVYSFLVCLLWFELITICWSSSLLYLPCTCITFFFPRLFIYLLFVVMSCCACQQLFKILFLHYAFYFI